jgi:aminoglycoside phosphotransferase (APT) family kinase protein
VVGDSEPETRITREQLERIAGKHACSRQVQRVESIGFINDVWQLGEDLILRIPRPGPSLWETWNERAAAPAAAESGIRTPRLVAFDGDLDVVDVPFTIYERIDGRALSFTSHRDKADVAGLYRTLGAQLATLHSGVSECAELRTTTERCGGRGSTDDGLAGIDDFLSRGRLSEPICAWLRDRMTRFAPAVEASTGLHRFLHHDLSPDNVLAHDGDISGIVDWGEATWGDPTFDLAHVPPRALPFVVEGYRRVAPFDQDDTAEARILWDHLDLSRWRAIDREPREWRRSRLARALELFAAATDWPDPWRRLLA